MVLIILLLDKPDLDYLHYNIKYIFKKTLKQMKIISRKPYLGYGRSQRTIVFRDIIESLYDIIELLF